jgi:ABC-type antimicrobial peptide transport system permease subunit
MLPGAPTEFEIVGVVANERFRGLERPPQPAYYLSTRQFPQSSVTLMVRTANDPLTVAADVRATLREVDPTITMDRVTTIDRILDEQLVSRRVTSRVISGFAATALALSALGMYGLLMMTVTSGRRDIGVRLAIGASPYSIAQRIVADGFWNALIGGVSGLALALASGRYLRGMLVGVTPADPALLAITVTTLLAAALLATVLPAWRASHVDPLSALRND